MTQRTELVLGLGRDHVPGGLAWRGVRRLPLAPYLDAVARVGTFRTRFQAEEDPSWKQIIPYLVLRDGERVFLMRRTRAGADVRLHDRYSLGIGGHVNPGDGDPLGGLAREWREEIAADFEPAFEPLGVLNDDGNAVGQVHLGLVFAADVAGRTVEIRETAKLSGRFATLDEVAAVAGELESWSALLLDFLLSQGESGAG